MDKDGGGERRYRAPARGRGRGARASGDARAARGGPRQRTDDALDWRRRGSSTDGDRARRPEAATTAPPAAPAMVDVRAPVVGTCMAMCSPQEVQTRRAIKDISRFETPADAAMWAVKKYRRPAAGRVEIDASELRPPHVLHETLVHLFTNVLPWDGSGFDWCVGSASAKTTRPSEFLALYQFLSDRLRSVRQDFVVQRVHGHARVRALVQIARFYVLASFRATQLLDCRDKTLDWSEPLNDQQLASALTEVHAQLHAKTAVASDQSDQSDQSLHEEALSFDVLLHLRDAHAVSLLLLKVPATLRRSASVRRVLALFVALHMGDSMRFIKIFAALPILQQCLTLRHLPVVWVATITRMNKAYLGKIERFALDEVAVWTGLPGAADARLLCTAMNIPAEDEMPPAPSNTAADSWESHTSSGFVRFKIQAASEELALETERKLLRAKANAIQHDVAQRLTATALILVES